MKIGNLNIRYIAYALAVVIAFMGVAELLFFGMYKDELYKVKLNNALAYLENKNTPVEATPALPWPELGLMARYNTDGNSHDTTTTYKIGDRVIEGATGTSRTALLKPDDVNGDSIIFILGGSAAFGYPYPYDSTFTSELQDLIGNRYRVINVAQVGWSSGQLSGVVNRIMAHYPTTKALILFSGNNEWIRWSGISENVFPHYQLSFYKLSSHSHALSALVYNFVFKKIQDRPARQREADFIQHKELSDYSYAVETHLTPEGRAYLNGYKRSKEEFLDVFRKNLEGMIDLCSAKGIPPVLMTVPIKYRLSPGWKHPQPLYWDEKNGQKVQEVLAQAIQAIEMKDWNSADTILRNVLINEPLSPILNYLMAVVQDSLENFESAKQYYLLARETCIGNLCGSESINEIIRQVSDSKKVTLIDVESEFDRIGRLSGAYFNDMFIDDDCHPNPSGHRIIAELIYRRLK